METFKFYHINTISEGGYASVDSTVFPALSRAGNEVLVVRSKTGPPFGFRLDRDDATAIEQEGEDS